MLTWILNLLFGCRHKNFSFPQRRHDCQPKMPTDEYVVCTDCGQEFPYDWKKMRVLKLTQRRTIKCVTNS